MGEVMQKTIGKLLFFLCLFSGLYAAKDPSITLRLLSIEGQEVTEVAVGEPFRLEVIVEGMGQSQAPKAIEIPGLDKINARRNGYFLSTINGVSTVKFNYQAQVDKPTFATLGPVAVDYQGNEIQSNKLKVIAKIGDSKTNPSPTQRSKKEALEPILRLYVDKKDAVIGERINARLRFYPRATEVQLRQLNHRDLPAFTMTPLEGPTTGQETVDGKSQQYVEWRWSLYSKEVGKLVIPSYSIDYDKVIQQTSQWSFLSLFGTRMENKRVHSNAQVITTKELPPYKGQVFLVGKLVDVTAEISPDTLKVGDAATLTIEIEGEGNIEGIEQINLNGMPSIVKFYESKNMMMNQPKTTRFTRKRFEFVVQGLKEGTIEIPSQTFTYYDVEQKAYEQKSTNPLLLTILPAPAPEITEVSDQLQEPESHRQEMELGPINTKGPWYAVSSGMALPWWLFIVLTLLPLLLIGAMFLSQLAYQWYIPYARRHYAFKRAHKQLVVAQPARDSRRIYYIMKSAISDYTGKPVEQISPEYIHEWLRSLGMPLDTLHLWDEFLLQLTQQVFAYHDHKPELFSTAHQWLNEWERLL